MTLREVVKSHFGKKSVSNEGDHGKLHMYDIV